MDTIAIGLGAFFLASVVLLAVTSDYVASRRAVYRGLRSVRAVELESVDVRQRELAAPIAQRVVLPGMKRLGQFVRRATPGSVLERLERELVYAGTPVGWDGERMLALKVAAAAGFFVAGIALVPVLGIELLRMVVLAPLLAFVGYYLPEWILRSQSGKRQHQIQRALPDALDLLSITVEAGLGFDAAVERVSREMAGPLGQELYRVVQEMRLGKTRSEALRDLSDRTTVTELKSFVLAMIQADIFGISIGSVLQVQAHEMRVKRRQRAEGQAQKVPVKIVFPLILCIFPALFVVILGPAVIQIYDALIR